MFNYYYKWQFVAVLCLAKQLSLDIVVCSGKGQCSRQTTTETFDPISLHLLVLLPSNGESYYPVECLGQYPSWDHGHGDVLPALDLAIEQINNRSDFLPCHKLELVHREAGCEITTSILLGLTSGMFPRGDKENHRPKIVGVIGPFCTRSSIQVSSITNNHPEMRVILLHSSGSPKLANRTIFPYSLGILGSTHSLVNLLLTLMYESSWQNISVLSDSTQLYYHAIMKDFVASVDTTVSIDYLSAFTSTHYPIHEVVSSRVRIIFVFVPLQHAKRIMCLVHHMNIGYPRYQWILVSQWLGDFMNKDINFGYKNKEYYCSFKDLVVLEGTFFVNYQMYDMLTTRTNETKFPQNTSFDEFLNLYKQRVDKYNIEHLKDHTDISPTRWSYHLYDAVWAWAIVLNKFKLMADNNNLEFGNQSFSKAALNEFYFLDFQGMSGRVHFNMNTGFVDRIANLYQVIDGNKRHLAYNNGTKTVTLCESMTVSALKRAVGLPHSGIVGFFLATHCVELVVVVMIHIFTFRYRDTKFVKASSPKLIQPAFVGAYIFILAMFLNSLFFATELSHLTGGIICQAVWTWLLPISFTLMMGIITVRAWRLYRIFMHYLKPGKSISNSALLTILLVLVLFDILIAIIWTAVDPNQFAFLEYIVKKRHIQEVLLDQSCSSKNNFLWMGLIFTYKIGLLFIMMILSILTYKIPYRAFSTTLLRVFSYVYSAIFIIGFAFYFLVLFIDPHSDISYIVLSVVLTLMLLSFITFVIIPPLIPIMKYKLNQFF